MSEKLKGDTSRPTATTASALAAAPSLTAAATTATVVKNPLLSASVTGLTFDDFPNKPLLLPPVAINREPKPLVTIGSPTDVDTESLDEINLNAISDETQSTTYTAANIRHIDPNENPLWSEAGNQQADSILTQAASSFSALPSVASNVLSTFSKRISEYSGSNSRERTPTSDNGNIASQLDIQPAYLQQQFQTQSQQQQLQQHQQHQLPPVQQQYPFYSNPLVNAPTPIAAAPPAANASFTTSQSSTTAPLEPPKFYTPTAVPILPAANAPPPPPAGGQNTYRLAAKKKLYAPIPGLTEQTAAVSAPAIDPLSIAAPLQGIPPLPSQPTTLTDPFGYPTPPPPQLNPLRQDEPKGVGLFANISNLVPSGVLQNISGLVQSAAGTFSQDSNKPLTAESAQHSQYGKSGLYQQPPLEAASVGAGQYFGASVVPPSAAPPPPTQFYPTAVEANLPSAAFFAPTQSATSQQSQQSVAQVQAPTVEQTSHLFAQSAQPTVSQPVPPPPTTGFVFAPPKNVTPESTIKQRPSTSTPNIAYFDPTKQLSSTAPLFGGTEQSAANPAPTKAPTSDTLISAAAAPLQHNNHFVPPIAAAALPGVALSFNQTKPPTLDVPLSETQLVTPAEVVQQPLPAIGVPLFTQGVSGHSNPAQVSSTALAANFPPQATSIFSPATAQQSVGSNQAPLPPTTGGSTSFRLQKGTRLYKSPLTTAETAPVQVQADIAQSLAPTASFFNPFGAPAPASGPTPGATTATPTLVPSYFIAQPAESSVGLFAVDKPVTEKKHTTVFESPLSGVILNAENTTVDPQLLNVPAPAENESNKESSIDEALTTADIGAIIQQQTIEAFQPELPSTENTTPLETSPEAAKQTEVLQGALEQLALTAQLQPQETAIQSPPDQEVLIPKSDQHQISSVKTPPAQPEQHQKLQTAPNTVAEAELNVPILTASEAPPSAPLVVPPRQAQNPPVANPLLPPSLPNTNRPSKQDEKANPFRKNSGASQLSSGTQPKLANFFAGALGVTGAGVAEFNIFTPPQQPLLTNSTEVQPSAISAQSLIPTAVAPLPSAAGFFGRVEPSQSSFFQPTPTQQAKEFPPLPPQSGIAPLPLTHEAATAAVAAVEPLLGIPPPLGFDRILPPSNFEATAPPPLDIDTPVTATTATTDVWTSPTATASNTQTQQTGVGNSFSNYFEQTSNLTAESKQLQKEQQQTKIVPPVVTLLPTAASSPAHFFDTFAQQQSLSQSQSQSQTEIVINSLATQQQQQTVAQSNEDQRLQNFFNNPPQRENTAGVGDLGYDLVHSGLVRRNLGSLTSVSNLVEPPSSSCSEFSEWNNSNVNPRSLPAELLVKRTPEKILFSAEPKQEVEISTKPQQEVQATAEPIEVADPAVTPTAVNYASDLEIEKHCQDLPEEVLRDLRMANMLIGEKAAASAPPTTVSYSPAVRHWFYKRPTGSNKFVWTPFSHYDSAMLETTLAMGDNAPTIVAVEGGRYDVNINERTKTAVYWECAPIEVRRCSWFYKGTDSKMVPYEESIAELLENEYKQAVETGEWHKKIVLSINEQVTFHGPTVIVHFQQQQSTDAWGGTSQTTTRPRVVKRDLEEFSIEQGESERVDHLLLMVHGIGAACDLKMRSVDEVVDDFRQIAQALVQSHYKNSTDMGLVGRVEVLPISWHSHLHSEEMGIDENLRSITLESIPKLRNFTNNTLLDVLFYTSPKYCQKIMNTVAASMNEVYNKYRERHPEFNGGVSVAGHSLGSLILFDLLCHQKAPKETEEQNLENPDRFGPNPMDVGNDDASVISYTMGHAGTGQPFIHYAQLSFQPKKFFALGSPIGMFVTIRGIDKLGLDFRLPTCTGFYNIFHPFDPVAYRIEALINPDLSGMRPVLIPHHKGRKRMHLELKETMTRVGADLKQRFLDTFKNTLESVNFLGGTARSNREAEENMTKEVDKVLSMQIEAEQQEQSLQTSQLSSVAGQQNGSTQSHPEPSRTRCDSISTSHSDSDLVEIDFPLGKLNDSKRLDYVLQEAPLEFINEYIFALGAHVCYWESEDTILFVMKEIYTGLGISPDSQVPQQTMTIERPSSQNSNPLLPMNEKR